VRSGTASSGQESNEDLQKRGISYFRFLDSVEDDKRVFIIRFCATVLLVESLGYLTIFQMHEFML
jgi:hypothetical protein